MKRKKVVLNYIWIFFGSYEECETINIMRSRA